MILRTPPSDGNRRACLCVCACMNTTSISWAFLARWSGRRSGVTDSAKSLPVRYTSSIFMAGWVIVSNHLVQLRFVSYYFYWSCVLLFLLEHLLCLSTSSTPTKRIFSFCVYSSSMPIFEIHLLSSMLRCSMYFEYSNSSHCFIFIFASVCDPFVRAP